MSKIVIPEIRDNYPLYADLLDNRKSITDAIVDISTPRTNHANFLTNDTIILKHVTLAHEIIFISEVKINNYKSFKFKLRCKHLCQVPFFRYDSDGGTHRNYDEENILLGNQSVTTPHFNSYNQDGLAMAYKTPELENAASAKALEDINFCIIHFCNEGNIRKGSEDFPEITILSKSLGLSFKDDDPNADTIFI